jgi:hypothetical protein
MGMPMNSYSCPAAVPLQDLAPQQILMGLMCGNLHLDIPEWCEPEWRGLLEACLEPNPSARPSMRELARQLEAIRDQQLAHEHQQQQQRLQPPAQQSAATQRQPAVEQPPSQHEAVQQEPLLQQQAHPYLPPPLSQQPQQLPQSADPAPAPAPVMLLQRRQQHQQQLQHLAVLDSTVKLQQVAQEGLQQQLAEQSGRMLWLENSLMQQQAWMQQALTQQQQQPAHHALHVQQPHSVEVTAAAAGAAAAAAAAQHAAASAVGPAIAVTPGQVQLPYGLPAAHVTLEQQQQAACALQPGSGLPHSAQGFVS